MLNEKLKLKISREIKRKEVCKEIPSKARKKRGRGEGDRQKQRLPPIRRTAEIYIVVTRANPSSENRYFTPTCGGGPRGRGANFTPGV